MALILLLAFIFYSFLSWILLLRDDWTLEVLTTKFYPAQAELIRQIQSFFSVFKLNTTATVLFFLFVIVAFAAYFYALKRKYSPKKIVILAIVFQAIVFFSYPILSTDVLNYILSDRVAVVYHQNVWTTKPNIFASDPFYFLVYPVFPKGDWNNQTRIYGPVNQAIYSAATSISGDDFLVNLAMHKLVVLLFNLATMALIYKILKIFFPDKLGFALMFIFWNPLFILETVGSGHNDILMIFFLTASYLFFLKKKPILTGLMVALAVNVKSTALLIAPLYAATFFNQNFIATLKFVLVFAASTIALFSTMGISLLAFVTRTLFSTGLYWQSLPQQLSKISPILTRFLTPLFLIAYLFQCFRGWLSKKDPLVLYGQTYLLYLLFALGAYWNWYSLWILTAFAFLGKGKWAAVAGAFTFASALAYPLYWLSLRFNYSHPVWPVIIYFVIAGGPVVAYIHDKYKKD